MMQATYIYILKKLGIWDFIWREFDRQYPVRFSAKSPEVKNFFEENNKAMIDMITYGMGAVKHCQCGETMFQMRIA